MSAGGHDTMLSPGPLGLRMESGDLSSGRGRTPPATPFFKHAKSVARIGILFLKKQLARGQAAQYFVPVKIILVFKDMSSVEYWAQRKTDTEMKFHRMS